MLVERPHFSQKSFFFWWVPTYREILSTDVLNWLVSQCVDWFKVPVAAQNLDKYQNLSDFCEYQTVPAAGSQGSFVNFVSQLSSFKVFITLTLHYGNLSRHYTLMFLRGFFHHFPCCCDVKFMLTNVQTPLRLAHKDTKPPQSSLF